MIINSVLSSTKDNSIQNNNHKKKILLNSKFPNQINNNININTKRKYENENDNLSKPQKKKLILPNNAFYEGFINSNNEFEGYGEYRSPLYNYFGYFSCGKKNGKGKLEDFVRKLEYNGDFKDNMKDGFGEEKYQISGSSILTGKGGISTFAAAGSYRKVRFSRPAKRTISGESFMLLLCAMVFWI